MQSRSTDNNVSIIRHYIPATCVELTETDNRLEMQTFFYSLIPDHQTIIIPFLLIGDNWERNLMRASRSVEDPAHASTT